jgi:acyl-CoA-binding protein
MARPKGSIQTKPTRADVLEYYRLLKQKAAAGDVNAAGWLLVADAQTLRPQPGHAK